jgi:aspartokinase
MHLKCCSIITRAEIQIVKLNVAHPKGTRIIKKQSKNEQVMHILRVKNTTRKFLDHSTTHEHHLVHA